MSFPKKSIICNPDFVCFVSYKLLSLVVFFFPVLCRQHLVEFKDLFTEYMNSKEGRYCTGH